MSKFTILILIAFLPISVYSQQLALGQWRVELPYRNASGLAASENKIYCTTEISAYTVDKNDYSMTTLSKVSGLSDIGTNHVSYDKAHNVVVLTYTNSNVDLLTEGEVVNISDIKRKNIVG